MRWQAVTRNPAARVPRAVRTARAARILPIVYVRPLSKAAAAGVAAAVLAVASACTEGGPTTKGSAAGGEGGAAAGAGASAPAVPMDSLRSLPVPSEHAEAAALFVAHCEECHGAAAMGTEQGPPLVHMYYRPDHHSDMAFVMAVQRGVRAHHWGFGDMPPRPEVSRPETDRIIGYVRWLQRQAGVL